MSATAKARRAECLRRLIEACQNPPKGVPNPTFVYAAPTNQHAALFWRRIIQDAIPKDAIRKVRDAGMTIEFVSGAVLRVMSLGRPEHFAGLPIDGVVIGDEFEHIDPKVWASWLRPALATPGRPGWAVFEVR